MLFHAQSFVLLFLPVTLAAYYALARHVMAREWALIAASLVFYAWWDVRFLPLLLGHIVVTWLLARAYGATGRRALLWLGVALNLASLAFFKYTGFLLDNLGALAGMTFPKSEIVLPIGISFFTFQCVSYLIDLKRGDAPQYPLRRLTLFVVLFPHLIAGPIVRHNEIIPQFDRDPLRDGLAERFSKGVTLFVVGLLLKVLVADKLAVHVDAVYAAAAIRPPGLWDAWLGILGFSLQIYFDFSAYSEMAIGLALMFGLHFPMNFDMPYRATSLRDFWRRWHMSLSRFLRDYLYIPLGGSREGFARFILATMITMGLCGLWHGAGWTFVIWGLLHGAGLVVCRAWDQAKLPMPAALGWLLTILFVTVAFMIFRAPDLTVVANMASGALGLAGLGKRWDAGLAVLLAVGAVLALLKLPNPETVERYLRPHPGFAVATALAAVYVMLEVGRGAPSSFIYFQF
jgi:D-alanyl-lipoteichoic acid acyltransferase DltB (MBOAT superfamily)